MCKVTEDGKIEGYVVRFGDADNLDLEGQYFTADTKLGELKNPIVYIHDKGLRLPVGKAITTKIDKRGVFIQAEIAKTKYRDVIIDLISSKVHHFAAMSTSMKVNDDGEITEFPLVGVTLTATPANPCGDKPDDSERVADDQA